jgi:lipopolysaccharide biosynthesis regulator YciM
MASPAPVPPPVVAPPIAAPPVAAPPVVAPPVAAPPVVALPVAAPPVVAPPVAALPVVAPPAGFEQVDESESPPEPEPEPDASGPFDAPPAAPAAWTPPPPVGPLLPGGIDAPTLADALDVERPLAPPAPVAAEELAFHASRQRTMRFVWFATAVLVIFVVALAAFFMTLRRSAIEKRFQSAAVSLALGTPDGYRAAAADHREVLRRDPANLRAAAELGLAAALLAADYGEGADAGTQAQVQRAWFAEAEQMRRVPGAHSAAVMAARILVALQRGDRDEAESLTRAANAAHPNSTPVLYAAAQYRRLAGDAEGSRSALQACLNVERDFLPARLGLAALDLDEGDGAKAAAAYGEILGAHPEHAGARLGRALALVDVGQGAEAEADLTGLLARLAKSRDLPAPDQPPDAIAVTSGLESWRQLALAGSFLSRDATPEAQAALEIATAGAPPEPRFFLRLMRARLAQGRVTEAKAALGHALKYLAPQSPQVTLAEAELMLGQGFETPVEKLVTALKPSAPRDLVIGRARLALGQPGAALEALKRVEGARPQDRAVRAYALLAAALGEPAKADLAGFKTLASGARLGRYALGRVLIARGDPAQARAYLAAARGEQPEAGRTAILLSGLLRDAGELGPALEALEKGVAETGDFAPARAALGRLYEQVGRNAEARTALGAVLGLESGRGPRGYRPDPDDYVALALADARLGFVPDAEAALAKAGEAQAQGPRLVRAQALVDAYKSDPVLTAKKLARLGLPDAGYLCDLGLVQRQAGNAAAAEAAYGAALKADPTNVEALAGLGTLYLLMPDRAGPAVATFERALAAWETRQFLGKAKRAQLQIGLGRAYLLAGPRRDPEKARVALAAAVADTPADAEAHLHLGRCLLAQNDARGAVASLARAIALDPQLADAHFSLGEALAGTDPARARAAYEAYLRLAKDGAHAALARLALDRLK